MNWTPNSAISHSRVDTIYKSRKRQSQADSAFAERVRIFDITTLNV